MKGTPRFLREYRGEVPGCPGGVGAYDYGNAYGLCSTLSSFAAML